MKMDHVLRGTTPETMTLYEDAAKRGAALLDERYPDWRKEIDVSRLDMSKVYADILALLYNDSQLGSITLGLAHYARDAMDNVYIRHDFEKMEDLGFIVHMSADSMFPPIPYAILTAVWINLITAKG